MKRPSNPKSFPHRPNHAVMTLRDSFATRALPALIERYEIAGEAERREDGQYVPEDTTAGWGDRRAWEGVAKAAYAVADALMAERAKGGAA